MGLDNYPKPYPCVVLEKAGKLKVVRAKNGIIDCDATNCPFKRLKKIIGLFGTYCWIRGKVYEQYVEELCNGYTLYEDMDRTTLENLLEELKSHYGNVEADEEAIANALHGVSLGAFDLIKYLETLLSIKEWDGVLVAWY